jgi:YidC/Oxa1 family membrane protein insertase
MLDVARIALYTLLVLIVFMLYQAWQVEHPKTDAAGVNTPVISTTTTANRVPVDVAPNSPAVSNQAQVGAVVTSPASGKLVKVTTDVLEVNIDTLGGDVVQVKLLNYPETLQSKTPFLLLNDNPKTRYIAESGVLSKMGPDTSAEQALYTATQYEYTLSPNANTIVVKLSWKKNGIDVVKSYTFTRGSYEVKVAFDIDNQSNQPWQGNLYTQLMRTDTPPATHSGIVSLATYFGGAISTMDKPFQKISFKEMREKNLSVTSQDGWAAMIQHYFISAWVPPVTAISNYYSRVTSDGLYTVGMMGSPLSAPAGSKVSTDTKLYVGPSIASDLDKTAPRLRLTIDYGWFWFISGIIFWLMQKIYDVIGNWGWSIVLVTVIIKLLFYQLSAKSYRSMSMMKKLQPRIEALKAQFGADKQKFTQATMELYRKEKVNPMTGCLPILIQIPVFIALYWVLVESVQLRQAPFIFWIHDLSQQDPYYVLPILMGLSMFVQQRLNPPPPDPIQAKVMMLMPIVFTVLFANFPAGLMLYWFVNNTLSFLQQWYVMRTVNKA